MKASLVTATLVPLIKCGAPVLLKGPPGVGKSDIVAQAAAQAGTELLLSHPVTSDPTDYKGLGAVLTGKGGKQYADFLPLGDLRRLVETTKPLTFFLDDLGQAPAAVQAAAMQLILARQVNGHKVSDKVAFVAATNRKGDRAGVSGILEPVKSRFCTILELTVDVDEWCDWAEAKGLNPYVISFIRYCPELLNKWAPSADIANSPCPRTVANAARLLDAGIPEAALPEALAGAVGDGWATQFLQFRHMVSSVLNIQEIMDKPLKAALPTELSHLDAVARVVGQRATAAYMPSLGLLATRLPPELAYVMFRTATRRDATLKESKAYIDWAVKHGNLLAAA